MGPEHPECFLVVRQCHGDVREQFRASDSKTARLMAVETASERGLTLESFSGIVLGEGFCGRPRTV